MKVCCGKLLALQRSQGSLLDEEVGQAQSLPGVAARGVAQVEENLVALAGALDAGGDIVDARGGQHAGLEVKDGCVLIELLAQRGRGHDGARERDLVGIGLEGTDNGDRNRGSGLALEHEAHQGQRKIVRGLAFNEIDHVAVAEMLLVGGRAGQHVDDGGVAEALGDGDAHLRIVGGGTVLVDLVLGGGQIAGVGIERVEQAVQRAVGHFGNIGLGDVVVLNLAQDLGVDAHLAVGGILLVAGMHAEPAELAQNVAQAECGEDHHGDRKDKTLKESGHTHHRDGRKGKPAAHTL